VLRVPLLLRAPGLLASGQHRAGPMALVDLVPTLSSLLGSSKPQNLDGQDISRHLVEGGATDPVAIYHEARAKTADTYGGTDAGWVPPAIGVTTWPRRLVRIPTSAGVRYEMYDLSDDPRKAATSTPTRKGSASCARAWTATRSSARSAATRSATRPRRARAAQPPVPDGAGKEPRASGQPQ
jgi:arylsulfatase A-like enzyme